MRSRRISTSTRGTAPPRSPTYLGGVALFASGAGAMRGTLLKTARMLAGASAPRVRLLAFQLHRPQPRTMVPAWIPPNQMFWAWATGAGHLAAGLALVSGIQARLAATLRRGDDGGRSWCCCIFRASSPSPVCTSNGSCSRVASALHRRCLARAGNTRLERRPSRLAAAAHRRCRTPSSSPDALTGVIESFVLREGTDYGERDVPLETKVMQVRRQLERREARDRVRSEHRERRHRRQEARRSLTGIRIYA